jgi:DNA-binding transcriptional LysR family regulator
MEIYQLRYLAAVADSLNYTRAANVLHVSQSALSRQIIQLEKELGVRVFERSRQQVNITDEGRVILAHAARILSEAAALTGAAKELAQGRGGDLVVSYNWRTFFSHIPDSIAEFRRRHPQSEVRLREIQLHEQAELLHSKKVHLGFMPSEFIKDDDEFERMKVLTSELVVVVSRNHRLANRKAIALRELANDTWLKNDAVKKTYPTFIRQYCKQAGFTPIFGEHGSSIENLLGMIAAGYGIIMMPRYVLTKHHRISSIRFLRTDCAPIELCAVWLRKNQSRVLKQYLEILRKHVRK